MRRIIRILAALSQRQISTGNSAMTTLTSPPLAALLTQLFADAEASDAQLKKDMSDQSPEEIARRASSSDYLAFYRRAKDYHLAVSPETGRLLYMLARSSGARAIVEFGTSFGISTIHLAAALRDNGGGRLVGSGREPGKGTQGRANPAGGGPPRPPGGPPCRQRRRPSRRQRARTGQGHAGAGQPGGGGPRRSRRRARGRR